MSTAYHPANSRRVLRCGMLKKPALLLRIEGSLLFAVSILCYRETHASWILFAALLLVPDVSMVGYLANAKIGATIYNAVHTLAAPLLLLAYAIATQHAALFPYALIWTTHLGVDRMLGYGLKYPTQFKDTHLQHV
jgi:hypothetical protein